MTERLFFLSDAQSLNTEILSCYTHEKAFAITLSETIFHPQGGGQPSDTGWIGDVRVLEVTQKNNQIIHHVSMPLMKGRTSIRIDSKPRKLHSRLHSAGHLIGNICELSGWVPIKAHHWPGEGKITFKPSEDSQPISAEDLQTYLDQLIKDDLDRKILMGDDGYREVSFGKLPAYACGGTHVSSLRELEIVKVESLKIKKNTLTVHYDVY